MPKVSLRDLFLLFTIFAMAIVLWQQNASIRKLTKSTKSDAIRIDLLTTQISRREGDLQESERQFLRQLTEAKFQTQLALQGAMQIEQGIDERATQAFELLDESMPQNADLLGLLWRTNDRLGRTEVAHKYRRKYKILVAEKATGLDYQD